MFPRFFVTVLAALPLVVLAVPTNTPAQSKPKPDPHQKPQSDPHSDSHVETHYDGGQCNVGELNCCNQIQAIPGTDSAQASGLVGIAANLLPLIGLNCDPISVLGLGGNSCAAQPVCCTKNNFSGLINLLNCAPININL